jgi:hypothetical protein
MNIEVLDFLKKRAIEMEGELIIQEISLAVINKMQIPGSAAQQYAQQKQLLELATETSKITLANLKEYIQVNEAKAKLPSA